MNNGLQVVVIYGLGFPLMSDLVWGPEDPGAPAASEAARQGRATRPGLLQHPSAGLRLLAPSAPQLREHPVAARGAAVIHRERAWKKKGAARRGAVLGRSSKLMGK